MKKKDLIIVIIAAVLAGICLLLTRKAPGDRVFVYKNGELFGSYPLSGERTVDIGGKNRLQISGGCAYIDSATCPDKLCIKQGRIKNADRSIVCQPTRVTVTVSKSGDADAVSR